VVSELWKREEQNPNPNAGCCDVMPVRCAGA
jgi:hypothetical protein